LNKLSLTEATNADPYAEGSVALGSSPFPGGDSSSSLKDEEEKEGGTVGGDSKGGTQKMSYAERI